VEKDGGDTIGISTTFFIVELMTISYWYIQQETRFVRFFLGIEGSREIDGIVVLTGGIAG
jgi:hypothetical protein